MKTLHVVTGVEDGEELLDEFSGDHVSFMTEPSGALVILKRPNDVWAAYAPGSWKVVRDASGVE